MALKTFRLASGNNGIRSMFLGYKYKENEQEPDVIIFTGGADINPELYNEKALTTTVFDTMRDAQDKFFWNKYKDIPKIGICRGAQFLNVMNGGSLWQHVNNHTKDHELINLLPFKGKESGDKIKVTSTHHQMMIPGPEGEVLGIALDEKKGKGLATIYLSDKSRSNPDFDTEIVWYEETKCLCFQPHPEFQKGTEGERYFFDLIDFFFGD